MALGANLRTDSFLPLPRILADLLCDLKRDTLNSRPSPRRWPPNALLFSLQVEGWLSYLPLPPSTSSRMPESEALLNSVPCALQATPFPPQIRFFSLSSSFCFHVSAWDHFSFFGGGREPSTPRDGQLFGRLPLSTKFLLDFSPFLMIAPPHFSLFFSAFSPPLMPI